MRIVDSSVVVPGVVGRFPRHDAALTILQRKPSISVHAAIETYAVLTRLPEPYRVDPVTAAHVIESNFGDRVLPGLPPRSLVPWLRRMSERGIARGAIYDALIAESARSAGGILVTADARASATYRAVGVQVEMLDELL
ncbi:MAG TPA: PIN domain-containing protein [Acidimicrobiales bacterium]|nr:PIN domain-containing protein [Acidimicrobiales bacterium]